MRPHVKICGLCRQEDLDFAARLGADLCGFVFVAGSPRRTTPEEAARLDSRGLVRVGVTTDSDPDALRALMRTARLDMLQLHGNQPEACVRALGLPPERIIRVLWPARCTDADELETVMHRLAPAAGLFLLDAGRAGGGSGRRIAPELLAGLRSPRPWLLAGGLGPDNVAEAVAACRDPQFYGVDLNSGLESAPGCKDHNRMAAALWALGKTPDAAVPGAEDAGTICLGNEAEKETR